MLHIYTSRHYTTLFRLEFLSSKFLGITKFLLILLWQQVALNPSGLGLHQLYQLYLRSLPS